MILDSKRYILSPQEDLLSRKFIKPEYLFILRLINSSFGVTKRLIIKQKSL